MFEKAARLWRETFPRKEQKLMNIQFVAAIEEFNEYFPGYADMNDRNYRRIQSYIEALSPNHCLPWYRLAFSSAYILETSLDEYLERNESCRREGLTGEWAIQIFVDHNEHIIEKYREYKQKRREKWIKTSEERKAKANKLTVDMESRLKWLLGREGYYQYNKTRIEWIQKEQRLTGEGLMQKIEAQKKTNPKPEVQTS